MVQHSIVRYNIRIVSTCILYCKVLYYVIICHYYFVMIIVTILIHYHHHYCILLLLSLDYDYVLQIVNMLWNNGRENCRKSGIPKKQRCWCFALENHTSKGNPNKVALCRNVQNTSHQASASFNAITNRALKGFWEEAAAGRSKCLLQQCESLVYFTSGAQQLECLQFYHGTGKPLSTIVTHTYHTLVLGQSKRWLPASSGMSSWSTFDHGATLKGLAPCLFSRYLAAKSRQIEYGCPEPLGRLSIEHWHQNNLVQKHWSLNIHFKKHDDCAIEVTCLGQQHHPLG